MVHSTSISITPSNHADRHRVGGADPLTGDVGIIGRGVMVSPIVKVYDNTAAPTSFTDLDLSSTVGSKESLVLIQVKDRDASVTARGAFRPNGNTESFGDDDGCTSAYVCAVGQVCYVWTMTDSAGICEWMDKDAGIEIDLWVVYYQNLD